MASTKIRGNTQIMDGTIGNAQIASNAAIDTSKLADGSNFLLKDGSVTLTGDLNAGGKSITNLAAPSSNSDAATKAYVDSVVKGRDWKESVRAATTTDITLSGTQTIDGVSLTVGDRVLVKDQEDPTENGIYVVASGAWSRSPDADTDDKVTAGLTVRVTEGTVNGDQRVWFITTDDPIELGVTEIEFSQDTATGVSVGNGLQDSGGTISVKASDTSITVASGGISVAPATNGGLEVSSGLKVKLDGSTLSLGSGGLKLNTSKFVVRENPTGSVNSSNTAFTLANTPVSGTEQVFLNGLLQEPGGEDYSISGATITFVSAPLTGDRIRVSYIAS